MKLEGSLDAFGLPDIFQLLSFTKKTGGLHLRSGAVDGVVFFSHGLVTGAAADAARQGLARRLVGSGWVDDDALRSAIETAQAGSQGVAQALLAAGAVGADEVKAAAADQVVDAVFDLLRWPEGDFAFSLDEPNPDDVGVELASERLVAEAQARGEAFDALTASVPSPQSVLSLAAMPPEDPALSRDDWKLVSLVDGRRSVAEVVELTGNGYYAAVSRVADLVGRGLLELGDGPTHVSVISRRLSMLLPLEGAAPTAMRPDDTPHVAPPAPAVMRETAPEPPAPARDVADEPDNDTVEDVELASTVGGPHVPENVVPTRPEPFLPKRQPEHPEDAPVTTIHLGLAPALAAEPAGSAESVGAPSDHSAALARGLAESRSAFAGVAGGQPSASNGSLPSMDPVSQAGQSSPMQPGPIPTQSVGGVNGSAAMAADPAVAALIERDPTVNRSLLLRLIAGVRGL